jgi:hypothetical protein
MDAVISTAAATPLPPSAIERACWLRYTAERTQPSLKEPTSVNFSNLRNGWSVRSPFVIDFAVRGMGVVPAGHAHPGTGHHHILVNQRLPLDVADKIPFNDNHRHFGKGQTSAVLDLPAGKHTLRLLFADHEHRPYFVYSPEITVTVTGPRTAVAPPIDPSRADSCAAWYQDEMSRPRAAEPAVHFLNVRDGEALTSPFNLRFGVEGLGVSASAKVIDKTGHFLLEVRGKGGASTVDLTSGATQTQVALPLGVHRLRLRFVDASSQRDLLPAAELKVVIDAQAR